MWLRPFIKVDGGDEDIAVKQVQNSNLFFKKLLEVSLEQEEADEVVLVLAYILYDVLACLNLVVF